MDSYALGLGCGSTVIDSKGAAIAFAVMLSLEYPRGCKSQRVNYQKAQKLFDFICSNVNLPDVKAEPMDGLSAQLGGLMGILEKTMAEKYTPTDKKEVSES